MEKKLHVLVCQLFGHRSYPDFDQKLHDLRAVPLMHSIWAVRTAITALELKEILRRTSTTAIGSSWWKLPEVGPAEGPCTTWER